MVRHKESIISGLVLMADNSLGYSMTIGHYKQRKEEEMIFFSSIFEIKRRNVGTPCELNAKLMVLHFIVIDSSKGR